LKLKSQTAWSDYVKTGKKPDDIPQSPYKVYKKEWKSWGDWLGTGTIAPQNRKYHSFEEARKFVRSLGLKNRDEWLKFSKSEKRPIDIPGDPSRVYKNKGWKSWGDWFDTGYIATSQREYRSFEEARKFVHSLKLKNQKNWLAYSKSERKPDDIPANPDGTYKKEWKGLGDWLGTGTVATFQREYRSFEEARKFVHSLGLKSANEWKEYAKSNEKPVDTPADPQKVYKKEWKSWRDWLGTGTIASYNIKFREFNDAKKFSRSLGLKSANEWREFAKSGMLPNDIPYGPNNTYKNQGWTSWGDFLGTGNIAARDIQFRSFTEAKKFIRSLGLKNHREWNEYVKSGKKPDDIPYEPRVGYSKENVLRRMRNEKTI